METKHVGSKITKDLSNKEIISLIEGGIEGDVLQQLMKYFLEKLLELERDLYVGVGSYERGSNRRGYRNGYKTKQLNTRIGKLKLAIPQTRDGGFYPKLLEKYQRSERALILTLSEAYIQGVSTRKMKRITEELLGEGISSTTVSHYCKKLDEEIEQWRNRELKERYLYLLLDARYDKCRVDHKIMDVAVMLAIGINEEGHLRVVGLDVKFDENTTNWDEFIGNLYERGIKEVEMIVSDHHPGILRGKKKYYPSAGWQRCQWHFMKNLRDKLPKRYESEIVRDMRYVWDILDYEESKKRLEEISEKWYRRISSVGEFLSEEGLDTLTVYRLCPERYRRKLRTNNIIERLNEEFKRRGRVVRIFPNIESIIRLYGMIAKEWDEDWMTGRKYLNINALEIDCSTRAPEQAHELAQVQT